MSDSPPAGAPQDVVDAWPAMCGPVRARYARDATRHRSRRAVLSALRWWAEATTPRRGRGSAATPHAPRILAIQPDHLGGQLLSTAAYRWVREALPGARITVLAGPWAAEVPRHSPVVDDVLTCPFPQFQRSAAPARAARVPGARTVERLAYPYAVLLRTAAILQRHRFDVALNLHPDFWWGAALAALAHIPCRIGYAAPDAATFLTHEAPLPRLLIGHAGSRPHVAHMQLALASKLIDLAGGSTAGGQPQHVDMSYEPSRADHAAAEQLWAEHQLQREQAVVAVHPGPGAGAKRWPAAAFQRVIDHLAEQRGARVILTGVAADAAEVQSIAGGCRTVPLVLVGQTGFGVLGALFDRCRLVVGSDNGALHLASARRVPNVRVFGPTDSVAWGPWPDSAGGYAIQSPRACSPCHRLDIPPWEGASVGEGDAYPCMRDATPDSVIGAIDRAWPEGR